MSFDTSPSPVPSPWRALLGVAMLAAFTFLIFGQTLRFDYIHFDDDLYVQNNPALTQGLSAEGVRWAFSANFLKISPGAEYWEPLTLLTRLADYQFHGFDPAGHHQTSVLVHLAAGLALWGALRTLTGRFWESFVVAALFLVHPMHVEPVCWLSARKDLVSGLFYILTIWAYAFYGKRPGLARYSLLLIAFLAANMAKPMAVSLPFLLCFLDFWPLQRRAVKWEKIPLFAIAILVSALAYMTQKGMGTLADDALLPLSWRLGNATLATGTYLLKALIPIDLALYYPHPGRSLSLPLTAFAAVGLLCLSVICLRWRKERPWLLVGFLWFIFVLGPVIGIIQIGDQAMADRYSYLSLIGIFIAVVWETASRLQGQTRPAWIAGGGVLAIFSGVAYLQTATWRDSISAFSHALEVTENNYIIHYNLASELLATGQREAAYAHLREAVRIRQPVIDYQLAKAAAEIHEGKIPEAIQHLQRVVMLKPWDSDLHLKLGRLYQQTNQRNLSQREFALAFHYQPELTIARLELAKSWAADGKKAAALKILAQALAVDPGNVEVIELQKSLSDH